MITSTQNRATIGTVMALGFLLAMLVAMLVSTAPPAGAATPSGKAFAWGYNYYGQLGNGAAGAGTDSNVPVAVKRLTGVKSVKAGCSHGLALKTDGTVWAWGYNKYGQLGNGIFDDSKVPVKVKIDNVKAISAGCSHSLALKENGSVWAWGLNYYGQLGSDTSGVNSNVPVKVANIGTGAKGIAANANSSFALMKDGTVRSWGYNGEGQLGNGTVTPRTQPGPVRNLSNVKAIATDSFANHALALMKDGTVKSWGYNEYGQLGDGTSGNYRTTPVAVSNLKGVNSIATGGSHSVALLGSGRVKSWGDNDFGQLGNDTSGAGTDRSTPVKVTGLTNVRSVSGGGTHSLAVLQSGKVKSWGDNSYGQLGNGISGTESDVPVSVKNLTGVKNIDGGVSFTLAVTQ